MKRSNMSAIMEEIQKQNYKLKAELISLRKQLNSYENKMMDQLAKLDPTKVLYQSPTKCLDAFIRQISTITSSFHQKNTSINKLEIKLKHLEYTNQIGRQKEGILSHKISELQEMKLDNERKTKENQIRLIDQIQQLKQKSDILTNSFKEIKKNMQIKQISIDEQKRVAVSAIIHQSKKQMLQFREQLQNQFLNQTIKMNLQIKQKDEKIKSLIKGLLKYDKGEKVTAGQVNQMRKLVQYIGNIEELNSIISQLKEQNFTLKKEVKETMNRKGAAQLKSLQLRNDISNLLLKNEKKQFQIKQLQELIINLRKQIAYEKQSCKNLQYYFQQKWHNQFQKVRQNLQKNYNDKIAEHERDLQAKKIQISRKIQSFVFLQKEDQKIIKDLKNKIGLLHINLSSLNQVIENKQRSIQELHEQLNETNQMIFQEILSLDCRWMMKTEQKQKLVKSLKQQLSLTSASRQIYQIKSKQLAASLEEKFKEQKKVIQRKHQLQLDQTIEYKQKIIVSERQIHEEKASQLKSNNEQLIKKHQFQLAQIKFKFNNEIQDISNQLLQQRKTQRQMTDAFDLKEKSYKKELQELKQYYMKKIYDLQRQVQNKKSTINVINGKSQNDQDLKKQLRQIIDQKSRKCKELIRLKQDLQDQIQAKESQINHLNYQNTGLRMSKDDWLKIIVEVRDDFYHDLNDVNENHWKQQQIYKSKIWQLENIISKRPIRIQDEKKIRSLSEQKKDLETKIDLKQAENIVLKQIKHYYEKKVQVRTCTSQMSLTQAELKKPQTVLIMNKRPKRNKINFYQSLKKEAQEQSQANSDIKKMRKYLQKFRQTNKSQNQDLPTKNISTTKTAFRKAVNKSFES